MIQSVLSTRSCHQPLTPSYVCFEKFMLVTLMLDEAVLQAPSFLCLLEIQWFDKELVFDELKKQQLWKELRMCICYDITVRLYHFGLMVVISIHSVNMKKMSVQKTWVLRSNWCLLNCSYCLKFHVRCYIFHFNSCIILKSLSFIRPYLILTRLWWRCLWWYMIYERCQPIIKHSYGKEPFLSLWDEKQKETSIKKTLDILKKDYYATSFIWGKIAERQKFLCLACCK